VRTLVTSLPGVLLVEPEVHVDARGFLLESYHAAKYAAAGIPDTFVQDNHSSSVERTLRGLHLQTEPPQAKLVRVVEGEILDVVVDVRRGSPTFGRWASAILSAGNFRQCYLPSGLAHGFVVRSGVAQVEYKCSDFYNPDGEIGIAWDDPALAIDWGVERPLLSERDRRHPRLADVMERLPHFSG
jgi:dTDP-4-dehydrorhamnose 3,5-epimerase